jgi:hypothetical protein
MRNNSAYESAQSIALLVVIAVFLAAGYVAWDQSFREEIAEQENP